VLHELREQRVAGTEQHLEVSWLTHVGILGAKSLAVVHDLSRIVPDGKMRARAWPAGAAATVPPEQFI
jgi:hypothetical protein